MPGNPPRRDHRSGSTTDARISAFLAPLQETFALSEFFWLFTGLMTAAAVIFVVLAYFYKGKAYLQGEEG